MHRREAPHITILEHCQYASLVLLLYWIVRPSDVRMLSLDNVQVRVTWAKYRYHGCLLVCSRNRRHELDTWIPVNSLWNKEEPPASLSSQLYLSSGMMPVWIFFVRLNVTVTSENSWWVMGDELLCTNEKWCCAVALLVFPSTPDQSWGPVLLRCWWKARITSPVYVIALILNSGKYIIGRLLSFLLTLFLTVFLMCRVWTFVVVTSEYSKRREHFYLQGKNRTARVVRLNNTIRYHSLICCQILYYSYAYALL